MPMQPAMVDVRHGRRQITRFTELSGAAFPQDLARRLEAAAGRRVGVDFAVAMAERLLAEGPPGLHCITLNRSTAISEIHRALLGTGPAERALAART